MVGSGSLGISGIFIILTLICAQIVSSEEVMSKNSSRKVFKTYCDPNKWFEFSIPTILPQPEKNQLDFSFLLDAPAGKHGFVKVKNGHFVFEDGTSARFFGLNIHSAKGLHLSHVESDALADRLASLGCNIVRLHSLERPAPLGILDPDANDTVSFDAERMDMLDYFIFALKQRGIYVKIDVVGQCHRRVKINDGLTGIKDYGAPMYKGIWPGPWGQCYFDPAAEDLAMRFSEKLLNHVNPYTKLRLADEPAIAFVELSNESNVARMGWVWGGKCYSEVYQSWIDTSWNRWLLKKYKNRDALVKAWTDFTGTCALDENEDPGRNTVKTGWPKPVKTWRRAGKGEKAIARMSDFAKFLEDSIAGYTQRMQKFLKDEIKVKYPILDTNDHGYFLFTLRQAAEYNDFLDVHAYWSHPPKYYNLPAIKVDPVALPPETASLMIPTMGRSKVAGLPLLISEWNTCWPDEWRSSDMLLMSAYSCLNDWDAPIAYSYLGGYNLSLKDTPKDIILHPTMFTYDPAEMGIFPFAALAFHRRYVNVSRNVFEYACSDTDTLFNDKIRAWTKICSDKDPMLYMPLIGRTQTKFFKHKYVPSKDVTMTINSGKTASGDYSAATHAIIFSASPFVDSLEHKADGLAAVKSLWPDISGWQTGTNYNSIDWGLTDAALPPGCRGFYLDKKGQPKAVRDSRYAAVPNSEKLTKYQLAEFVMNSAKDWNILKDDQGYSLKNKSIVSDTGEIRREFGKGRFIIDTDRMMAFSGFYDDGTSVDFKGGRLELNSPFATVVLISIDGKPLSESEQMVLMAQGRCDNAGSVYEKDAEKQQYAMFGKESSVDSVSEWNGHEWSDIYKKDAKLKKRKIVKKGSGTIVVEPVLAEFHLLRNINSVPLEATLIDQFGQLKNKLKLKKNKSGYIIPITSEWNTIYCLINRYGEKNDN